MQIDTEERGPVLILTPEDGELDASSAEEFKADVQALTAERKHVVCDLRNITFVDSAGLGALLSCLRRVAGAGGDLKLCCPTEAVDSVLRTTRMHRVFDVLATREEALGAFAK